MRYARASENRIEKNGPIVLDFDCSSSILSPPPLVSETMLGY
jgi:hypothetical protein